MGITTWTYDNAGNRLVEQTPTGQTTSTYDAANRQRNATDVSGINRILRLRLRRLGC